MKRAARLPESLPKRPKVDEPRKTYDDDARNPSSSGTVSNDGKVQEEDRPRLSDDDETERRRAQRKLLLEQLQQEHATGEEKEVLSGEIPEARETERDVKQDTEVPKTPIAKEDDSDSDDMFADTPPPQEQKPLAQQQDTGKKLASNLLDNWDDADGYYRSIPGELLDGKYLAAATLGKGMFASVIRATNTDTQATVAIKIMRNNDTILKAGYQEMALLQKLRNDDQTTSHVVQMLAWFEHKGHLCLVFENLDSNLRDVLKKYGRNVGINLSAIRSYARQMLQGLAALRAASVVHSDLKPDNILVTDSHAMLKICDLGSARQMDKSNDGLSTEFVDSASVVTPYLASRFYRAPELILGLPRYDTAIDMWAAGCTLFEMYTGQVLFPGRTNNDMLRLMMATRGRFNNRMLRKGAYTHEHFDKAQHDDFISTAEVDPVTKTLVTRTVKIIGAAPGQTIKDRLAGMEGAPGTPNARLLDKFVDLLNQMLALNPEKRPSPADALKHAFLV